MITGKRIGKCLMCDKVTRMTKHHIVPLAIKPTSKQVLMICDGCHRELNKLSHKEQYETVTQLLINLIN